MHNAIELATVTPSVAINLDYRLNYSSTVPVCESDRTVVDHVQNRDTRTIWDLISSDANAGLLSLLAGTNAGHFIISNPAHQPSLYTARKVIYTNAT